MTQIVDVNTADTGGFTNLPSGWSTLSGGGLNLATRDQKIALGRTTEETSPAGNISSMCISIRRRKAVLAVEELSAVLGRPVQESLWPFGGRKEAANSPDRLPVTEKPP